MSTTNYKSWRTFNWSSLLGLSLLLITLVQQKIDGTELLSPQVLSVDFGLNSVNGHWWQALTYFLVHVNAAHCFANVADLFLSRGATERSSLHGTYPFVFFVSAAVGTVLQLGMHDYQGSSGASGAIAGVTTFGLVLWLRRHEMVLLRHGLFLLFVLWVVGVGDARDILEGDPNELHFGGYLTGLVLGLWLICPRESGRLIRYDRVVAMVGNYLGFLMVGTAAVVSVAIFFTA